MTQHAYAYTYPEPEAETGTSIFAGLLEQFAKMASNSAAAGVPAATPPASGQVPIGMKFTVGNSTAFAEALLQIYPQIVENGGGAPRVANDNATFVTAKSVGEQTESLVRYWDELDGVRAALHERRSSSAQEQFMFDVVAGFIEKYGVRAVRDLHATIEAFPRTARYFFPYLLGHLDDEETQRERLNLLDGYRQSRDEDIREGAIEALGNLSAA